MHNKQTSKQQMWNSKEILEQGSCSLRTYSRSASNHSAGGALANPLCSIVNPCIVLLHLTVVVTGHTPDAML